MAHDSRVASHLAACTSTCLITLQISLSLVAAIRQLNDISYTTLIAQGRCESAQSSVVGSHALSRKDLSTGCTRYFTLSLYLSLLLSLLHSHCPTVLFFSHFMAKKPTTSVVRHLIRFNVGSTSFLAFSYNFPLLFKLHTCTFYDCAGNSLSDSARMLSSLMPWCGKSVKCCPFWAVGFSQNSSHSSHKARLIFTLEHLT